MAAGSAMGKPVAVAAALCLMMVASGLWHETYQKPTLLLGDRDIFIKAQAAQQMQDYVKAFGTGKGAQSQNVGSKHTVLRAAATVPDMAMPLPAPLRAKKSSKLLNHWDAINDVVFPKKWMHAKPVHHESRKQQESQEMEHIRHVNAKTIPAAHKHKMLAQPTTSGAMLSHYDHLFDSTFDDTRSSAKFSNPTSQTELAHLKDLSDAVFPKEEAVSGKHWTATKQNLLAHYKQLSDAAFPDEHFSHNAPMSGDEELAQYKAESNSVNPSEKRRAHHQRVRSKEATASELAHLKDISSRVFPASEASRSGSRQTARDSEAAELAGFNSVNKDVFPKLHSSLHHQQTSDEELASLHKLSDSVFPAEHAARHHQRGTAQQELEAGMKMVSGREFHGKLRKVGKKARGLGIHGVAVGSKLHAEPGSNPPWHRKKPVNHVEGEKRNVV